MRYCNFFFIFFFSLTLGIVSVKAQSFFGSGTTGPSPVVTLGALNKITAKLETIDVKKDETVKFGTLEITMRDCKSNPPEETPESVAFLEITDLGHEGNASKVFEGWMFASSPAVSSLEHAVYDVWVMTCKIDDPSAPSDKE